MAQNMTPKPGTRARGASPDFRAQALKAAVRRLMRLRGQGYQDLADHLDVSLATVKRFLNQEELTLSRLLSICDWLGVTLAELHAAATQETPGDVTYTEEQELFLAADPRYLVYLYQLWSGETPETIARRFKLKKSSTDRYLLRLEQLGMVRVTGKGRAIAVHRKQPNWRPLGPLARTHYQRVTANFAGFFQRRAEAMLASTTAVAESRVRSSMNAGPMTRDTYTAMAKELREVVQRYEDIAGLEEKLHPADGIGKYALTLSHTWLEPGESIAELENTFGVLTDL